MARTTDCCTAEECLDFAYLGTPGFGNTETGPPGRAVLPEGSFWRYRTWPDAPPSDWTAPEFDDTGWALGRAPLGYGEDDLETIIDPGAPEARVRTVWARAGFELDSAPGSAYLRLRVDDGAMSSSMAPDRRSQSSCRRHRCRHTGDHGCRWERRGRLDMSKSIFGAADRLQCRRGDVRRRPGEDLVLDLGILRPRPSGGPFNWQAFSSFEMARQRPGGCIPRTPGRRRGDSYRDLDQAAGDRRGVRLVEQRVSHS